jgi:hypothetical protein
MRLLNYTDIPNEKVRDLIRFVRPAGISHMKVLVFNGRFRGRCIGRKIKCYIPKDWKPQIVDNGGAYLPIPIGSRIEALVVLLAHELRHVWQGRNGHKRNGMVWGARGQYSERDADAYALRMLRHYRRECSTAAVEKGSE